MDKAQRFGYTKSIDEESRTLEAIATKKEVDRHGEVVLPSAFKWKHGIGPYKKNPVIPWAHGWWAPTFAKTTDIAITDDEMTFVAQFAETDFAEELWQLYKGGFLNAWSIGFKVWARDEEPIFPEQTGPTITKAELYEISGVVIPSNRDALVKAVVELDCASKFVNALDMWKAGGSIQIQKVVPYKRFPLAPMDEPWRFNSDDKSEILDENNWNRFLAAHAWCDPSADEDNSPPQIRSAYRLAHHKMLDGKLKTCWRGVAEAMSRLLGTAKIPEEERRGAYNHLVKHYEEFNKEVPEFNVWDEQEILEWHFDEHGLELEGREPFQARILEFQSLEAALRRLNYDLAQVEEIEDPQLSEADSELLRKTSTAIEKLLGRPKREEKDDAVRRELMRSIHELKGAGLPVMLRDEIQVLNELVTAGRS